MNLSDKLVNGWLKYHNTTLDEVRKNYDENDPKIAAKFLKDYAVTQQQHDEWYEWMKKTVAKEMKLSKKYVERGCWAIYLNTSPMVKEYER